MAQKKMSIGFFFLVIIIISLKIQSTEGRKFKVSNKLPTKCSSMALCGNEAAASTLPPPPPPLPPVTTDTRPPAAPGHADDFRPTTPGHSPGIGHSL
ncbi:hypothetical protein MIMGU_mgv11b016607mg [Erythranthe guttata]|uniref:Uncharacterized protein n=1 Tax=Erythranthe guttata TaxID=4155 RepID=A0A022RV46_ERYGU|nr:hypothetical protein MIMGU_mgv11b016607mg [Erythranthe guttata]